MDAIECIKTRQSIRSFKPEPISKKILMEIINIAKWSPSYKNSQPWGVVILSGAKKEALTALLLDLLEKDTAPCPDLPEPKAWPDAEEARMAQLLKARAERTGSSLNDPKALKQAKKANFNFYGAPHAIYLFQDNSLSQWSLFDLGLFAQTLMLAAKAKGIGTVPQAFAVDYAREIKRFLSIPETKRLVLGISIGYPDMESPANAFRSDRADTGDYTTWLERL